MELWHHYCWFEKDWWWISVEWKLKKFTYGVIVHCLSSICDDLMLEGIKLSLGTKTLHELGFECWRRQCHCRRYNNSFIQINRLKFSIELCVLTDSALEPLPLYIRVINRHEHGEFLIIGLTLFGWIWIWSIIIANVSNITVNYFHDLYCRGLRYSFTIKGERIFPYVLIVKLYSSVKCVCVCVFWKER